MIRAAVTRYRHAVAITSNQPLTSLISRIQSKILAVVRIIVAYVWNYKQAEIKRRASATMRPNSYQLLI